MMRRFAAIAVAALLSRVAYGQAPAPSERQLLERTVQMYFDAWAVGDSAMMGRAMHASAHLKRSIDGKFVDLTKEQYIAGMRPHARDSTLATRIASVDIVDKVSVRLPRGSTTGVQNPRPEKETVMEGLKRPWGMAFLSATEALISEKEGDLLRVDLATKTRTKVAGFPADMADSVGANGFGDNTGKFDVVLDPDFASNRFIYLSYAARSSKGRTTKVVRARLTNDSLQQVRTLLVAEPYTDGRFHYGGGMVFGQDGKLYITVGERLFNERDEPAWPIAQDRANRRGKIYRINRDGSIPADNPSFGRGAVPGLYALGIRASQGLTQHPVTHALWFSEHGTIQGDELNILKRGANYGWPLRTTGRYRDSTYVPPPARDSLTAPVWSWSHTVAPTALLFYTGLEFPTWKNSLLVGGLSRGSVWRMTVAGESVVSAEELFVDNRERVREVAQSPSGELYLLTDDTNGKLIRVRNGSPATVGVRPGR